MYKEYHPHTALSGYIDAYWSSESDEGNRTASRRILPDTCTDIIINLGAEIHTLSAERAVMKTESCHLVGTMTRFSDISVAPASHVFGVRFRPFALQALLRFSLSATADKRSELQKDMFDFKKFISPLEGEADINALNRFFLERLPLQPPKSMLIFHAIREHNGMITVAQLAAQHQLSERQLERIFYSQAGITVKQMCNQVRLQHVIKKLKTKPSDESLLGIALETGFYDHAHLANTIKKHTGYMPTYFTR